MQKAAGDALWDTDKNYNLLIARDQMVIQSRAKEANSKIGNSSFHGMVHASKTERKEIFQDSISYSPFEQLNQVSQGDN